MMTAMPTNWPRCMAAYVDSVIWGWLKEWFKDRADLRNKLELYRTERGRLNAPVLSLLQANENLIADHQTQLARPKDMCQAVS
jgi:hypothetical protein